MKRYKDLVTKNKVDTIKRIQFRIQNRDVIKESQNIALKVLMKLDELGWTQKNLAEKMEVSPQQVSKILKGNENMQLSTIVKLQNILDIKILAPFKEKKKVKKQPEMKDELQAKKDELHAKLRDDLIDIVLKEYPVHSYSQNIPFNTSYVAEGITIYGDKKKVFFKPKKLAGQEYADNYILKT